MDLQRGPRRSLFGGLFGYGKRTSECSIPQPSADDDDDESSRLDDQSSIFSSDEISIIRIREQRDILMKELQITKENLQKEKKTTHDLNQRLIMKAISIDCQLSETEEKFNKTRAKAEVAYRKNHDLTDKLRASRIENQNLMKRTAALARRDQIQKATILASNAEILKLMDTIEAFQERFLSLADSVVIVNEKNTATTEEESSTTKSSDDEQSQSAMVLNTPSLESVTPFEEDQLTSREKEEREEVKRTKEDFKAKLQEFATKQKEFTIKQKEFTAKQLDFQAKRQEWESERTDLFECITKLKSNNGEIKKKFVQTLKKHQWKWHKEKEKLMKKVGDLEVWLEEKEAELILTKNALAEAVTRGMYGAKKGGDIEPTDTFGTLTTQEESLSTCSTNSSLTLTYTLTEDTNNLSRSKVKKDSYPISNKGYSYSVSAHTDETPPRSNKDSVDDNDKNVDDDSVDRYSIDSNSYSSPVSAQNEGTPPRCNTFDDDDDDDDDDSVEPANNDSYPIGNKGYSFSVSAQNEGTPPRPPKTTVEPADDSSNSCAASKKHDGTPPKINSKPVGDENNSCSMNTAQHNDTPPRAPARAGDLASEDVL